MSRLSTKQRRARRRRRAVNGDAKAAFLRAVSVRVDAYLAQLQRRVYEVFFA